MHKLIQAILPVLLLFMILPIYQPDAASAEGTPQSDGVIVKYKETSDEPINELIEKVEVPKGESTDNLIEELEEQKDVEYAEPNYLFKKMESPNDPAYIDQWHHKKLGTSAAWTKSMGSKELIVAIIDDGIDRNHEDLKGGSSMPMIRYAIGSISSLKGSMERISLASLPVLRTTA